MTARRASTKKKAAAKTPAKKVAKKVAKKKAPAPKTKAAKKKAPAPKTKVAKKKAPASKTKAAKKKAPAAESAAAFGARLDDAYFANTWEERPYAGPVRSVGLGVLWAEGPASQVWLDVPEAWGAPRAEGGGLAWSLDDAEVTLRAERGPPFAPEPAEWLAVLQDARPPGWRVAAGRPVEHPQGPALEVGEVRAAAPRAARATRFLFAGPALVSLTVTCPDALPAARGGELVTAFASVRVLEGVEDATPGG